MGRFIEKKDKPWLWGGGGIGAGLAIGFALAHIHTLQEWRWDIIAQPLATLGAGTAAIIAAWIALHNGKKTREQDKEIHEAKSRAEQERTLRERFTSIVELLATEDLTKRESGAYALAALADDWAAFYKDDQELSLKEQQVCLNILTRQLRDPILEDSPAQLFTFKERVQDIIFPRFEGERFEQPGQWSDLYLTLEHCHFYNLSSGGVFKQKTSFSDAHFHGNTYFKISRFCNDVIFKRAQFHDGVDFRGSHFNIDTPAPQSSRNRNYADFSEAKFFNNAIFDRTKFYNEAIFNEACFIHNELYGENTAYPSDARFTYACFYSIASFEDALFQITTRFQKTIFSDKALFTYSLFGDYAFFPEAVFKDKARFNNAQFRSRALFTGAKFYLPLSDEYNKVLKDLNVDLSEAEFNVNPHNVATQ